MKLDELRREWDELGRIDPMWAVLTHPDRRDRGWDAEAFFATGREEIERVMRDLDRIGLPARRGRCLDFGCGVGRLTQALAGHFEKCDGVDIAPSMVEEARRLNHHGARCTFHLNDTDDLALFEDGAFDFVYTNIVLQHVGPAAAKAYILEFLRVLAPSGLAMFQLPSENIRAELRDRHRLPDDGFAARIAAEVPKDAERGEALRLVVAVTNTSARTWPADPPTDGTCRIRLGNHWHTADGELVLLDDARADLPRTLLPGESAEIVLTAAAPAAPGRYLLALDLVQEDVAWFGDEGSQVFRAPVRVRGGPGALFGALFGARTASSRTRVTDAADDRLTLRSGGASAVMRMQPVPKEEVLALVAAGGGRTVEVKDDPSGGREWRSFRYAVARRE